MTVAQTSFDAGTLVQEMITKIGTAPGVSDSCVLLWLITAANTRLAQSLSESDNALRVLLRRRSEIADKLVGELDETSFFPPDIHDDEGGGAQQVNLPEYVSLSEALLLDIGLASAEDAIPWLTFQEADQLFGSRVSASEASRMATRRDLLRTVGILAAALGISAAAIMWLALRLAGVDPGVSNPAAIAVGSLGLAVSVAVAGPGRETSHLSEAIGVFFLILAALASVVALNQTMARPYISDEGGLIAGGLIASAATIAWIVVKRNFRSRSE
jgi:hypothetical protein